MVPLQAEEAGETCVEEEGGENGYDEPEVEPYHESARFRERIRLK